MGKKVGFVAWYSQILPEETSIHTAQMTGIKAALKEIQKREDKKWVIYADSWSSFQSIEYNKENHSMLNQIYDILAGIQTQGKKIIQCKVPAHIRIKGNKDDDTAEKQTIDMPEMTTTRLHYTDRYLTFRSARNSEWQNSNSKLHYIKPCIEEWESAHNS